MTEIEFEKAIVELAHMFGWLVASFRPAQTGKGWRTPVKYDGKGWPDLVLIHGDGYMIFAEIKTDVGRLSDEQKAWAAHIERCITNIGAYPDEVRYCLWKPKDLPEITRILSFGRAAA